MPKSSATITFKIVLVFVVSDQVTVAFATRRLVQEKEKKNVSSLVEAALDEESDSEDEMEVSFTKASLNAYCKPGHCS